MAHSNRMVVILYYHQRAAPRRTISLESMAKMKERPLAYSSSTTVVRSHEAAPCSLHRRRPSTQKRYVEHESDLDEDAVAEHEEQCKTREIEKAAEKRFAKDN